MSRRPTFWPGAVFGTLFAVGGSVLLANGIWHLVKHGEGLIRLLGGAVVLVLGLVLAIDAFMPPERDRKRHRARMSKRTRSWPLFLIVLTSTASVRGQASPQQVSSEVRLDQAVISKVPIAPSVAERRAKLARKYDITRVGDRGIGRGLNLYSAEKELRLGRKLAGAVDRNARLVTDPVTTDFVSRLALNLARHSDATVPFTVKVIESDDPNVFALPGGFLYVTTGLIAAVESEAELAGLMAHEVAHVAARHGVKQASKRTFWKFASMPLIFVGPVGFMVRQVAGVAMPMKFSRDAEREADLLGVQYLYLAGYDPGEFVQFFERLGAGGERRHSALAKVFSDYPALEERIAAAREVIEATLPERGEHIVTTSDFDAVRAHILHLRGPRWENGSGRPVLYRRTRSVHQ